MKITLIGAELEENLGLRYMISALENKDHQVQLLPFNSDLDLNQVVAQACSFAPRIVGLSMVFTNRGKEFCQLAQKFRNAGFKGHIIAGGPFAALNCENLLSDYPEFDSVGLGEGEEIICDLADHPDDLSQVAGICYRDQENKIIRNPSKGNPENLDALAFPKRTTFHRYFNRPIASILSSRGCWRNCAFCSINAWYESGGGKKFRLRSIENLVAEMKLLYFQHGVRIFNFQDDNFFLLNHSRTLKRFQILQQQLAEEGIEKIAIAVKARPDSIQEDLIAILDTLGLFRVFLGVENASENGLRNLNRKCQVEQTLHALEVLNKYNIHVAYNLLMFEPNTLLEDILINIHFIERHIENPFNFCRAEVHTCTGLQTRLEAENRLLGDYFGFDYRIKDSRSEAFHFVANYAFFDRNFSDSGLHYFNMQVDFYYQLLRRFQPEVITQSLRASVKNFIKATNIDTYKHLSLIYDFIAQCNTEDKIEIQRFAQQMRYWVEGSSRELHFTGEQIIQQLTQAYENRNNPVKFQSIPDLQEIQDSHFRQPIHQEYQKASSAADWPMNWLTLNEIVNMTRMPMPYSVFKKRMSEIAVTS